MHFYIYQGLYNSVIHSSIGNKCVDVDMLVSGEKCILLNLIMETQSRSSIVSY